MVGYLVHKFSLCYVMSCYMIAIACLRDGVVFFLTLAKLYIYILRLCHWVSGSELNWSYLFTFYFIDLLDKEITGGISSQVAVSLVMGVKNKWCILRSMLKIRTHLASRRIVRILLLSQPFALFCLGMPSSPVTVKWKLYISGLISDTKRWNTKPEKNLFMYRYFWFMTKI